MSVAIEKQKRSSERYALVSITGKRDVLSDLALKSGNVYTATLPGFFVSSVKYNGTEYTAVATENPSTGEFYFDGSTFEINLASLTGSVIVYFKKFYTTEKFRYADVTNHLGQTVTVEYEPKLSESPKLKRSVKNVYSGIVSLSDFALNIIDSDLELRNLNTPETSFYNGMVDVDTYINDLKSESFKGVVTRLTLNGFDKVSFSVTDEFKKLDADANFGDSEADTVASGLNYPNLDPAKEGAPIPYFIGPTSWGKPKLDYGWYDSQALNEGFEGININYGDESTTKNNVFILGRVGPQGLATQSFGTSPSITHNIGQNFFTVAGGDGFNICYGDCFKAIAGGKEYHCFLLELDRPNKYAKFLTTEAGGPLLLSPANASEQIELADIQFRKSVQASMILSSTPSDFTYTPRMQSASMGADGGFAITETLLPSGNYLVKATLTPDAWSLISTPVPGGPFYDPSSTNDVRNSADRLVFTMQSAEPSGHTDFVKRLLGSSGIDYVDAKIEDADSVVSADVVCQVPGQSTASLPSYRDLVQQTLAGSLGFLYFDITGDMKYSALTTVASGNTVDDTLILEGGVSASIEYQDIYNKVSFTNQYLPETLSIGNRYQYTSTSQLSAFTIKDDSSKYLNEVDKTKKVEHLFYDFTNMGGGNYYDRHLSVSSNRRTIYSVKVSTELIDKTINEDLTLSGSILVGETQTENVKILSIEKGTENTKVTLTDLKGL